MQTLRETESPIKGVNFQEAPLDMRPPEEIVLGHIGKLCYEHWGKEDYSYCSLSVGWLKRCGPIRRSHGRRLPQMRHFGPQ